MTSMSNRGATCSRSSSARSKHSARVVAQTSLDAKIHTDFEESEQPFDYSTSIGVANRPSGAESGGVPPSAVSAYLQRMQRGKHIQPFGCMLAIEDDTFIIIAYSENAPEMLDLASHAVPSIEQREALTIGTDVRTLFKSPSAVALQKAASFGEVNLLNPILVHCKSSGKPFYAIMHRIDVGLVIDLEPVNPADVPVTAAGALKSYKLAAKAISRLQSLPSGNIPLLCDVLVKEVSELTGYDRVMAYKFHEDEHGEVIAECRRSDLEPYLGLHYPATDIPQASRFLFMKNKVRMICDCSAPPVKVIQDKRLPQPLSLGGSTLRAPHGCHAQYMANMGSIASLVMSVTINEDDDETAIDQQKGMKLWGLVVCHHTSPRFVPFPLRYACEFLLQVFGIQLNKEVELATQAREKHILRTQTVLCDMLLRDAPVGIFTQSPNVMDLVKCDGAALYYKNQFWLLEVTPTEAQIRDIAAWLLEYHNSTTGLSTDSLTEAGYPRAAELGDAVCGMAAIKITSKDFIFWFRSHTAKEIKWGGAKHDPGGRNDEGRKMHPRSSFKAFLEVVKRRSLPWEDVDMDAIHSLQLILRGSLQDEPVMDNSKTIVNATPDEAKQIQRMDEVRTVTAEMVRLIETATVPILAVDASGNINGWNTKAAELTGLSVEDAIGFPFVDLVEGESVEVAKSILRLALQGKEEQNVQIKLKTFGHQKNNGPVILIVNACCSRDINNDVVGICFVGQDVTGQKLVMDKYTRLQGDYTAIVSSPNQLIPPIFITDEYGCCSEWNAAMAKLSGLSREDAIDKILIGEVFSVHSFGCRVKDHDTLTKLRIVMNAVIAGQNAENLLFGFFDVNDKYVEALLTANARTNTEGRITGVLCFLHVASSELQHALQVQRMSEQAAINSLKELAYLRQEIRNPLHGIVFTCNLMEASDLTQEQKQLLRTSGLCQEQLRKILDDMDLESIEQCYLEMNAVEFNLGEVVEAVVSQGMSLSREQQVSLVIDSSADLSTMYLYGDNLRLQQVLADFLLNTLQFTSPASGSVLLKVIPRKEHIGTAVQIAHLEFRIIHPAPGVPEALVQEMFRHSPGISREGLGLYISQKLVKIMNGTVQYLREAERSSFIILVEFPLVCHSHSK
ncbi:phytochrome C [Dioscorea cayenensis subsp. rotundata]|uniref:Phytochrome n=2 Tax=Dioscorea TaxID=4672 RepID=A0AB40BW38_DIOCR|nr:phytochrome C [Dioscorea cayenensis subsp. rotundata]XP_039130473.1 phytochrome C [Dioscorea cayenensis subsp. rotundata]